MSPHCLTPLTDTIVASILEMYAGDGERMHLRFEDQCLSLRDFLRTIIPYIGEVNWPLDKEEISRIWHYMYVLYERVQGLAMERAMPPARSSNPSEEILLHSKYVMSAIEKVEGRSLPDVASLHVDPTTGYRFAPTSEIRLTSFRSIWFHSTDLYVKRIRVLKQSALTTLFVSMRRIWNGKTRYNITWLPHAHLRPLIVQRRCPGSWAYVTSPAKNIWKWQRTNPKKKQLELTALIFNITGHTSAFASNLKYLVEVEKPKIIIITGTGKFANTVTQLCKEAGYGSVLSQPPDETLMNGFFILWNPRKASVESHPAYPDTMHLRIKASQPMGGSRISKVGHIFRSMKGRTTVYRAGV